MKTWLLFLSLFLIFLLPPTDPDLGWHLRCGQEIWQEGTFCNLNRFSTLLENYPWVNHYWLYQAFLFPIFALFGLWGLTFSNAILLAFAFLFFFLAIKNFLLEKILAIVLTAILGWGVFSFGLRSQLLAFFFFSLLLYLASKFRQKNTVVVFCPLIIFLWANLHGGSVILGLILLSFFFLSFILTPPFLSHRRLLFSILYFLFSISVTLLNPFGFKIYQEAWQHFAGVDLGKLIAEWVPPTPFFWWLILLSTLGLFFYLFWDEDSLKTRPFLLLPFTLLAIKARRNVPFYFLLAFYLFLIAPLTKRVFASYLQKEDLRNYLAWLALLGLLFFGLFLRLPETIKVNSSWKNYCQENQVVYPCSAIEFLENQSPGNIFNRYEWGGFLIWQLPNFKIFVDGRMPAWLARRSFSEGGPTSPYTIYLETLQTQPGWQETLKDYSIDWILISPGTFMDLRLKINPQEFGWQEVYRDKVSVIYKRI